MLFRNATIVFLLPLLAIIQAQPAPVNDSFPVGEDSLEVVFTEEGHFGTLVWYGVANDTRPTAAVLSKRACGTNNVTCSDQNLASTSVCVGMIKGLSQSPNVPVSTNLQVVCNVWYANPDCCFAWRAKVPGMVYGDLAGAAQKILDTNVCQGGLLARMNEP